MSRARDAIEPVVYHTLRLLSGGAARAYYSRIDVRHAERIPARGPLIIAANHPASLTDVVVLGAMLPRRAHFVAYSGLFEPWPLGLLLRLAGTVPVYRQQEGAENMHRNQEMFRACNETLALGGAVLIFPEGTSFADRRVERLRTGTARMALAYEFGPSRRAPLTLLPIGVHFEDRTRFQSHVTLSVGRPVELASLESAYAADPQATVREVTDRLQVALEKLILNIPSQELARLVRDVERLYSPDLREHMPGAPELLLGRGISECVEFFRVHDRERLHQLWLAVNRYQRKLHALHVEDGAIRRAALESHATQLVTQAALGALPALAGGLVHYVPYQLSGSIGRLVSSDPTRIAFARMVTGAFLFPASYAGLGWYLWRRGGWSEGAILSVLAVCIPLGLFSLGYFRWVARERDRLRVVLLAVTHRRMVARLRAERRRLMRLLDRARDDFMQSLALQRDGAGGGA